MSPVDVITFNTLHSNLCMTLNRNVEIYYFNHNLVYHILVKKTEEYKIITHKDIHIYRNIQTDNIEILYYNGLKNYVLDKYIKFINLYYE